MEDQESGRQKLYKKYPESVKIKYGSRE